MTNIYIYIYIQGKGEMFTYFLLGEDTSQRLQRLSSSLSSGNGLAAKRFDPTADASQKPVKLSGDRGWHAGSGESKRPPRLPQCVHGNSCDLVMESIFPNFRRSLVASSKRRRFRYRSTIDAAVMSNSLQDCSVNDSTTTACTKDSGIIRQKDLRIPKSSILEFASETEFQVLPPEPIGV